MIPLACANGSGDLDMAESEDRWPLPKYNPGDRKHLHALGVIAITFATLERSLDLHFLGMAKRKKMPKKLSLLYYFNLNEEKRIEATRSIFEEYEKDKKVRELMDNLLDYFKWCRDCRNQLLHAEQYPTSIGADPAFLYLTKRIGKQSARSGYLKINLERLRFIADKMREGIVRSAEMHIHFRYRDLPREKIPEMYRPYVYDPFPEILHVPKTLKLSPRP